MDGAPDALSIIKRFTAEHGYPPTVRELAPLLGFTSTASVFRVLTRLREQGKVTWNNQQPRTLRVIDDAKLPSDQ